MRIPYEEMTPGQLRLEFAARCQFHGCDAGLALCASTQAPEEFIRERMLAYRDAIARLDDKDAEDALIEIIEFRIH